MVYGIAIGTFQKIMIIYGCLEAVDSAVLAKKKRQKIFQQQPKPSNLIKKMENNYIFLLNTGNL